MAVKTDVQDLHRFTLDEYHELIEAGAFEGWRVELIDGLLHTMSAKTDEHEAALAWLNERLVLGIDRETYYVGPGSPLTLERSEPEPDVTVVRRDAERPYHPATAALAIEVCWSSRRRDLVVKPPLYAAAAVPDYWVVDLRRRRVVVHREPRPTGYAAITEVERGGQKPVTAGLPEIDVDALFRAAGV